MIGWIIKCWRAYRFRKQRELYTFYDGRRWRRLDPWRTYRVFLADPEYNVDTMAEAAYDQQEPEYTFALNAICRTFGLQQWSPENESGMTEEELLKVFADFCDYMESVKKKRSRGLTLSPDMVDGLSTSLAAHDSITNSHSLSPSLAAEPESERQESLATA